jgi:hypothetical protein
LKALWRTGILNSKQVLMVNVTWRFHGSPLANTILATNYIGDIYGTLGGTPDFGPADYDNNSLTKRKLRKRRIQV